MGSRGSPLPGRHRGRAGGHPGTGTRLEEFASYRDDGLSIAEAGLRLDPPVKDKTAYRMERESKALRKAAS